METLPEQAIRLKNELERVVDGNSFPLTITVEENFPAWLATNSAIIDNLLQKHRGILFRNCAPMDDHNDFHNVIEATGYKSMDYIGGAAVRTQLTARVFTANESPASEVIPFHHEMAQTPHPPTHLFFFCEVPPSTGGETPILVSSELYRRLHAEFPEVILEIEQLGVKYVRIMPTEDDHTSAIGRGWKSTFLCNTREEAEDALRKLGSTWEWLEGGDLKTVTSTLPAIRTDNFDEKRSQEKTFFNSLVAAYTGWNDSRNNGKNAVLLGDDRVMHEEFMIAVGRIMNEICVAIPWQKGDLLLLDNRTTMHSRRSFEGGRRILAGLARDPER